MGGRPSGNRFVGHMICFRHLEQFVRLGAEGEDADKYDHKRDVCVDLWTQVGIFLFTW